MRTDLVVGVDATRPSRAALAWAFDDAARRGVATRAVLAWADGARPAAVDTLAVSSELDDLAQAAGTVLRNTVAAARRAAGRGAPGTVVEVPVYSDPVHALLQESLTAGMIVVGAGPSRRPTGRAPGSVGNRCAQAAPVPVVVVPGGHAVPAWQWDPCPVVVGVDGSPPAATALRWAAREAALREVTLKVVHVRGTDAPARATVPAAHVTAGAGVGRGCPAPPRCAADETQVLVHNALAAARAVPGLSDVDLVLVDAVTTADGLVEAAREAQLLVVGARGGGGFPELRVGSTASGCLAHAACPVAVVRGRRAAV